jgi:hypothetical protein
MQVQSKPREESTERRKIIIKKKPLKVPAEQAPPSLSFRLIDFSIYDQKNVDAQSAGEEQHHFQARQNKKMVIQIFGIN